MSTERRRTIALPAQHVREAAAYMARAGLGGWPPVTSHDALESFEALSSGTTGRTRPAANRLNA